MAAIASEGNRRFAREVRFDEEVRPLTFGASNPQRGFLGRPPSLWISNCTTTQTIKQNTGSKKQRLWLRTD